jgi:hypothetical protein
LSGEESDEQDTELGRRKRSGITKSAGEDAMDGNILGLPKRVMSDEGEMAGGMVLAKSATRGVWRLDKAFNGMRGENGGSDTRGMVAEDGDETLDVWGRKMQNAIAFRSKGFAIGRYHARSAWTSRGVAMIRVEVRGVMRSRGLCSIVKMSTWAVKI